MSDSYWSLYVEISLSKRNIAVSTIASPLSELTKLACQYPEEVTFPSAFTPTKTIKTAEPIEIPFGFWTRVGQGTTC